MNPTTNIAVRAARQAGSIVMRSFNRIDTLTIAEKRSNDYVSEVDRASEQAIIETIRRSYPHHAILADDGHAHGTGAGLAGSRRVASVGDGRRRP